MSYFGSTIIRDMEGHHADINLVRELRVSESIRLAGATFQSGNDTNQWTTSSTGTGASANVTNIATLVSGTSNSGYGQITSVPRARFLNATPNEYRGLHRLTATTASDNTRRWGAFTLSGQAPQDGFYFEQSGAGVLSVVAVKGGTPTAVSSGSFNITPSYTVDTDVHVYEISYFMSEAVFYIDGQAIHRITPTTTTFTSAMSLPASATSINSASGTTSGTLECWLMCIKRLGVLQSGALYFNIRGNANTYVIKVGTGKLQKLVFNNTQGTSLAIFDNTAGSGASLGVITTAAAALGPWDLNIPFYTGLTIVTTGNGLDMTVVYE